MMFDLLILSYPDINPIAIKIGPLAIHWYSLAYIAGLIIGWKTMVKQLLLKNSHNIQRNHIDDFFVWAVIGVIVGGRIGYVIFYDPQLFIDSPMTIIKPPFKGMSFHGGLIGVVLTMLWFSKRNNISFFGLTDLTASVAPIGILFGRIANFVNGELWGRITESPWAMIFPNGGPYPRHPSQLYQAFLEGFVLLVILQLLYRNETVRKKPGMVTGIFLCTYGFFRAFVELFREPDAHIGFVLSQLTLGQMLTIPMIILGTYIIFLSTRPISK